MYPLLQIGGYALQVPGLILILSIWISLNVAEREAKREKYRPDFIYGMVFHAGLAGIIGSRLWYVGRYFSTYLEDPLEIIALNTNTLVPAAGFVISMLVAILYGLRKRLPLRTTLDILAPGLAFFAIGIGLANLASGAAFGTPTDLPWAIYLWDANRHPTQVYEMITAIVIFTLLWRHRRRMLFPGFMFLLWLTLAALARLFLEAFRGDSVIVAGGIRQSQLAALGVLLLALWLMRQWQPEEVPYVTADSAIPTKFRAQPEDQASEKKADVV